MPHVHTIYFSSLTAVLLINLYHLKPYTILYYKLKISCAHITFILSTENISISAAVFMTKATSQKAVPTKYITVTNQYIFSIYLSFLYSENFNKVFCP
jgi:hypothetical protein